MKNKKSFVEMLGELVEAAGGIKPFARKSEVNEGSIRHYLRGGEPGLENFKKIAKAGGKTVSVLAGEEEEGSPTNQSTLLAGLANGNSENPRHDELISKTSRIVTSKTIYRSALERSIDAFYQAVETEDETGGVKEELVALRKENRDMAERMERMEKILLSMGGAVPEKRDPAANA